MPVRMPVCPRMRLPMAVGMTIPMHVLPASSVGRVHRHIHAIIIGTHQQTIAVWLHTYKRISSLPRPAQLLQQPQEGLLRNCAASSLGMDLTKLYPKAQQGCQI